MSSSPSTNRPRNWIAVDATQPFTLSFVRYGKPVTLRLRQTPDEETWPGGAVWDMGILLAQLLVASVILPPVVVHCGRKRVTVNQPERLEQALKNRTVDLQGCNSVLELGCGVGLTGLVAALLLRPKCTILTDLGVVVEKVTLPNIAAHAEGGRLATGERVLGMELQWGSEDDEQNVLGVLRKVAAPTSGARKLKKGKQKTESRNVSTQYPDLVLIGDVAYQHKPGAPSHFENLVQSLLRLTDANTLVLFGTRIRMPASNDLLAMFLEHFDPVFDPIQGDEIDASLRGIKHNTAIHFLRKKPPATGTIHASYG